MPRSTDAAQVSAEELLLAEADNARSTTTESAFNAQGAAVSRSAEHQGATVTHTTSALRRAYKPTPQGYTPRNVAAANLPMLIRQGWLAACPDCGRANCGVDGNLNDCTGRPPRAYRTCPECRITHADGTVGEYRIWDDLPIGAPKLAGGNDPNEIRDGLSASSTPATRTEALWRAHMLAYHPQEAPTYGVYAQVGVMTGLQPQVGIEAGQR